MYLTVFRSEDVRLFEHSKLYVCCTDHLVYDNVFA